MPADEPAIDDIVSSERLTVDVARTIIGAQQKQIAELREIIEKLQSQIDGENPTARLDESYSLEAEARRKAREEQAEARRKKKRA
jgi:hypothetical protein